MTVVADGRGFWLTREDPAGGELVRIRAWAPGLAAHAGSRVVVGIRPEHLVVADRGSIPAIVERPNPARRRALCGCRRPADSDDQWRRRGGSGDAVRLRVDHMVVFDRSPARDHLTACIRGQTPLQIR